MTGATIRRWGPPPRFLVAASVVVLCVTAVLAVLGAFDTGITTDEPIHVMRLRNFFDTGWYALDWDYGGDGPGGDGTNTFVYAPVTMLVLHAWSVLCGVEGWHDVATTPHAYDVRHLGVVVLGLGGVAAVAAIGRVVLHQWRWGLVAAAVLSAVPMWTGHEMFNVKDVPVATGHTLVTLGLVCFVRADRPRPWLRLARAGCVVAGLVLALGTRPGMWSSLLAVLVVAVVGVLLASSSRREAFAPLAEMAASCVIAAIALVGIYPNLFGSPLRALPRTTETSSSFLAGQKSNRLYVPLHVAEDMPTLLLLFLLTGAVVGVTAAWTQRRSDPVQAARISVVGVQAFAMPVVAIVVGADLYHGLRQLLFFLPAAAVLAAYGMAWLLGSPMPKRRQAFAVAAVAALALPVIDQVTLQPYQTTYVNLATDLVASPFTDGAKLPGSDFWRVSLPELIRGRTLDRQLLCKAKVDKVSDVAFRFTNGGEAFSTTRNLDCREEPNGPLAPQRLPIPRPPSDLQYDAVFLDAPPANCTPVNEVTRRRHGFETVLTVLARCTDPPAALPEQGARADDVALGTATEGDLWLYAMDGWEQWPGRQELVSPVPVAELAFLAPDACREAGCTALVEGSGPPDLVTQVAGEEVPSSRDDRGTLRVPITADQAADGDGVWLSFSRSSGGPLGMRLTGLSWARSATQTSLAGSSPAGSTEGRR